MTPFFAKLLALNLTQVCDVSLFTLHLAPSRADFYRQRMKRLSFLISFLLLATFLRAQDAATTERLDKLNGLVQDLIEDKAGTKKQLAEMSKEIQSLREQMAKPSGNYASADDLRRLAEKLQEVDKKRVEDNERIVKKLDELAKTLTGATTARKKPAVSIEKPADTATTGSSSVIPDKGFEYIVQSGDSLSVIAAAYKEKGIKVSVDQILKANPNLKPTNMKVGQKIFIPAPEK
jgi:LysM repeat protein